jgi:hypothetical protein
MELEIYFMDESDNEFFNKTHDVDDVASADAALAKMIPASMPAWVAGDCADDNCAFIETYKNEEIFFYAAKNWLHGDPEGIIKFMSKTGGVIAARKV